MGKQLIPVFFTADDNYAYWLSVAINSLVKNASGEYEYKIFVLHDGISEERISKIKALEKPGVEIEFRILKESFEGIHSDFIGNKLRADYFTLTIFFRLFIPDMFPQFDKAVYIDSDVVVNGDVAELYNLPLKGNLIAACPDYSIQNVPDLVDYTVKAVGVDNSLQYINSGVLLMDMKALREKKLGERFLELLNKYHVDCIAPDQDYLNGMCKGKILFLGPEWDAMPNNNNPELPEPKIIHYNLFEKPWLYDGVQYADYFWRYAEDSGFIDEIRAFKAAYSDRQKASDAECLKNLVGRGAMLAASEGVTMRRIFEEQGEARL